MSNMNRNLSHIERVSAFTHFDFRLSGREFGSIGSSDICSEPRAAETDRPIVNPEQLPATGAAGRAFSIRNGSIEIGRRSSTAKGFELSALRYMPVRP